MIRSEADHVRLRVAPDERQFDRAEVFDISRPSPTVQLAFGYGEHYCLGANLARVQLRAILGEIYRRIPDIHPAGEPVFQATPLFEALVGDARRVHARTFSPVVLVDWTTASETLLTHSESPA